MRVLLQRVTSAQVSVDDEVVGRIDPAAAGVAHRRLARRDEIGRASGRVRV
ncbi:hypothetical protein [Nocardia sp. NPDC003354]